MSHAHTSRAHKNTTITFEVNSDSLDRYNDEYLAQLWHISQANPAPFGDRAACEFAEAVGHEIIRRYVSSQPPSLWAHQGRHVAAKQLMDQNALDFQSRVDSDNAIALRMNPSRPRVVLNNDLNIFSLVDEHGNEDSFRQRHTCPQGWREAGIPWHPAHWTCRRMRNDDSGKRWTSSNDLIYVQDEFGTLVQVGVA